MITNKYAVLWLFLSILLLSTEVPAATSSPKKKPQPPVQISIVPVEAGSAAANIKPGDEVSMQVTVVASLDAPEMRITVSLTGGTELVSGELSWHGPSIKGETTTVSFVVRAPHEGRGKVSARVQVISDGVTQFSSHAVYELVDSVNSRPSQPRAIKKDSKGHGVVEYR